MFTIQICLYFAILSVYKCNAFDANEDVIFKLYKRDNPTTFTLLRINDERSIPNDTLFDPELPTRIHIHGFLAKEV